MPEIVGRLRTPRLASAPATPAVGEMYYNTATNTLYWWNGTAWVSASGGAGADLVYNGDFPAATPYTDGDIVISGNVAYLCVRPTSATPTPWTGGTGGGVVPDDNSITTAKLADNSVTTPKLVANAVTRAKLAADAFPNYATTLPASPVDGQQAILVDSITNPAYQWLFRYNAGSTSAYKWEFIGGPPIFIYPAGFTPSGTAAYLTDTAVASTVNVPRAGEYIGHAMTTVGASGASAQYMGFAVDPSYRMGQAGQGTSEASISLMQKMTLTVGQAVQNVFYCATVVTTFAGRKMTVQPVRVS